MRTDTLCLHVHADRTVYVSTSHHRLPRHAWSHFHGIDRIMERLQEQALGAFDYLVWSQPMKLVSEVELVGEVWTDEFKQPHFQCQHIQVNDQSLSPQEVTDLLAAQTVEEKENAEAQVTYDSCSDVEMEVLESVEDLGFEHAMSLISADRFQKIRALMASPCPKGIFLPMLCQTVVTDALQELKAQGLWTSEQLTTLRPHMLQTAVRFAIEHYTK